MMDKMDNRVKQALIWYDTAANKYQNALDELKKARELAKKDYGVDSMESPLVKKWRSKVTKYEEKLSRASSTLYHVTMVMVSMEKCEDAKEIILGYDEDDDEEN